MKHVSKSIQFQNVMKIHAVGDEVFHVDGRTGQTDMTKLIVAFCNFANAPKNIFPRRSTLSSASQRCVQMVPKPLTSLSVTRQQSFLKMLDISQGPL
jgi:hypothetical protein